MKRGRRTAAGVKVRQGRPRTYPRALSGKAAFNCELALEPRCRCRCRGRSHGLRREIATIPPDDAHAGAVAYDDMLRALQWIREQKAKVVDKL